MYRWRLRAQCVEETDTAAVKRKSAGCFRTENGEKRGHIGTGSEKVPRVEGAGEVEAEMPTGDAVPKFCLVFVKTALQLMNKRVGKEVESTT